MALDANDLKQIRRLARLEAAALADARAANAGIPTARFDPTTGRYTGAGAYGSVNGPLDTVDAANGGNPFA